MKHSFSNSFFLFLITSVLSLPSLVGCQSDPYAASTYFDKQQEDSLLTTMITYMGRYAPGANNQTRFYPRFRSHYVKQLSKYKIDKLYVTPDSVHYFFVIRPVGEGQLFQRGVGGRFRLKADLDPVDFEEMWCTPHLKDTTVISERGGFLFRQMIKNGNVDQYLKMKDYVEWPDSMLRYDKKKHEWVSTVHSF